MQRVDIPDRFGHKQDGKERGIDIGHEIWFGICVVGEDGLTQVSLRPIYRGYGSTRAGQELRGSPKEDGR